MTRTTGCCLRASGPRVRIRQFWCVRILRLLGGTRWPSDTGVYAQLPSSDAPVRAVVKQLSDRDLVIAQGQENSARADLSFVERARFARRLEEVGYDRETIISALSVDKTTISRMISVATRIPAVIVDAIGPAPGTGRDRWVELSNTYQASGKGRPIEELLRDSNFIAGTSDQRFSMVEDFLARPSADEIAQPHNRPVRRLRARGQTRYWSPRDGARTAKITANDRAFVLAIDKRVAPDFGEYLLAELDQLYESYSKSRNRDEEC